MLIGLFDLKSLIINSSYSNLEQINNNNNNDLFWNNMYISKIIFSLRANYFTLIL